MKKTYIIGDVHGEYKTLLTLIEKLPKDAEIIFVGDLIDRGANSREIIKLIRKNSYRCVLGNHEKFMIDYGTSFTKTYPNSTNVSFMHSWYNSGGIATLQSYNLIKQTDRLTCIKNREGIKEFKEDIEWLKTLPLYIELPQKIDNLPVVISHACCADVWHLRENTPMRFREYDLLNRKEPKADSEIFNIFGHTPVEFGVKIEDNYVNVDTGCYIKKHGYSKLSAYCVESGEVVTVSRVEGVE